MVNRKHGLTAAKDFLRHADIAITAAHYIDRPRQATSGLGALLKATQDEKIVAYESDDTQARSVVHAKPDRSTHTLATRLRRTLPAQRITRSLRGRWTTASFARPSTKFGRASSNEI